MPTCPRCDGELEYTEEMDSWYCERCEQYVPIEGTEGTEGAPARQQSPSNLGLKILVLLVAAALVISSVYLFFHRDGGSEEEAEEVTIQDISDIRELEVLEEIEWNHMSRDELGERISNSSSDGGGDDVTDNMLRALFLLEPGAENTTQSVQENYTEKVMGFYDSQEDEIFVIEGSSSVMKRITLAHELTHALQDQHYDLLEYKNVSTSDSYFARQSVYEGDATLVQYKYMMTLSSAELEQLREDIEGDGGGSGGAGMPYYLDRIMSFPYTAGYEFVSSVYGEGGWEAVDGLYTDPPQSTEQIMHPQKYRGGEGPMDVEIDVAVPNMTLKSRDVMGEFVLNTMMAHYLSNSSADRAADGWGGDEFRYYSNDTGHVSIFKIKWDDGSQADEFASLYHEWTEKLPDEYSAHVSDGRFQMIEDGNVTTLYHGSDPGIVGVAGVAG